MPSTTSTPTNLKVLSGTGGTTPDADRVNSGVMLATAEPAAAEPAASDVDVIKQAVRARIRADRRARTPEQRAADATALAVVVLELPEVAAATCVALYASLPTEPGTEPLRTALRTTGTRVLLPVVRPDGRLDWAEDDGDLHPVKGPGGPEPATERLGPEAVRRAQVVIVPALAVDTLGNRLGQGAGYYDRALGLVGPAVPVLALVHDSEVHDAAVVPVPTEPHDVPVDGVVTPHRCLRMTHRRVPRR